MKKRRFASMMMAVPMTFGLISGTPVAFAGSDIDSFDALEVQTQEQTHPHKHHHPTFKSSVQLTDEQEKDAHLAAREAFERAMREKLGKLAKVSPEQAKKAALQASPGYTVHHVILRPVHHNLVYVVFMTHREKPRLITVVDAGNGKVLEKHELQQHREQHKRTFEKQVNVNE
jgi:uncharacterized membrane protein YkoI